MCLKKNNNWAFMPGNLIHCNLVKWFARGAERITPDEASSKGVRAYAGLILLFLGFSGKTNATKPCCRKLATGSNLAGIKWIIQIWWHHRKPGTRQCYSKDNIGARICFLVPFFIRTWSPWLNFSI